jgi:hypothetical protein
MNPLLVSTARDLGKAHWHPVGEDLQDSIIYAIGYRSEPNHPKNWDFAVADSLPLDCYLEPTIVLQVAQPQARANSPAGS